MSMILEELKDSIIDLSTGEIQKSTSGVGSALSSNVTLVDASYRSAEILIPNLGSDEEYLIEGKVDVRRFSDIELIDVIWLNWFMNIPDKYGGEYARDWSYNFLNLMYSVKGKHKKIVVNMQNAISGLPEPKKKEKDKGFFSRFRRNKDEDD